MVPPDAPYGGDWLGLHPRNAGWTMNRWGPGVAVAGAVVAGGTVLSALELVRLRREVRTFAREALTDPLTGFYNRRGCERRLAEDLAREDRSRARGSLTLVAADLDGLKVVNDCHGHAAGDAYLTAFGALMQENLRTGDWVGRWAGDEFVVALWEEEGGPAVRAVLDRLVKEIIPRSVVWLPDGQEVSLSASFGVAAHHRPLGCRRVVEEAGGLLRRADEALLEAKRRGKEGSCMRLESRFPDSKTGGD